MSNDVHAVPYDEPNKDYGFNVKNEGKNKYKVNGQYITIIDLNEPVLQSFMVPPIVPLDNGFTC